MEILNPEEIERRFGADPGGATFPFFCNALIAHEAPATSSFPVLASKAGPDGGLDGEWDLTNADSFEPVSVARKGWNVYQFKTVDSTAAGAKTAFGDLCRKVRGAVKEITTRAIEKKVPSLYVLFTNLHLGPETRSTTRANRTLNDKRKRLRDSLLEGALETVEVQIIDAAQIVGFVERHPGLRLSWFSPLVGTNWDEMRQEECRIQPSAPRFVGRDDELAELHRWLEDKETRVIAVSGPNSVGKTRLAIEATLRFAPVTLFVKDAATIRQMGLAALVGPSRPLIIVTEDPPLELVEPLAKQAVSALHPLKLLLTISSPANVPVVKLGPDKRIKEISVKPLSRQPAEELVKAVNPSIDSRIRSWIIQQSGGIPGVLVAAAEAGNLLRLEAESLRMQLLRKSRQRLLSHTDRESLSVLQLLSPFIYVDTAEQSTELGSLLRALGVMMTAADVLRRLAGLEKLGYLRRRGNYVSLTPPLFAAGLFQELIDADSGLPIRLFAGADFSARVRLLERLVMTGLPESNPFWAYIFGDEGPFSEPQIFANNLGLLDYLARAVPNRVVLFLQQQLDFIWSEVLPATANGVTHLAEALFELLDEPATAVAAFSTVVEFAKREAAAGTETTFSQIYEECFVYWYYRAIPYALKNQVIDALTADPNPAHRRLAIKAMIIATNPPDTLSGHAVRAQRLHSGPLFVTWREIHDFLLGTMRRRLTCCASDDLEVRALALEKIGDAISKLAECLPGVDAMTVIREANRAYRDGNLPVEVADLYEHVRWVRAQFEANSKQPEQSEWAEAWRESVAEIDHILIGLVGGVFEHRLKIALGRSSNYEEVIVDGRRLHGYQAEIVSLAREVSANPSLMDSNAWSVLSTTEAVHAQDFALYLGEEDKEWQHLPVLESQVRDAGSSHRLGCYLLGNPDRADQWLKAIIRDLNRSNAPNLPLLPILRVLGPTATARECLWTLLSKKLVSPSDVASTFFGGRWLDNLPMPEVLAVLEFIISEPEHEGALLGVVALYLHDQKPLPRELLPVVRGALTAPFKWGTRDDYNYNQVAVSLARTDLEEGFRLFVETTVDLLGHVYTFRRSGWNPLGGYGSHDFWEYLRDVIPERAYKCLGGLKSALRRSAAHNFNQRGLLNLTKHRTILLTIARDDEASACAFASCLLPASPEFYSFAAELIGQHPNSSSLRGALCNTILPNVGFGTMYDQFSAVEASVKSELSNSDLPPHASDWLQSLLNHIEQRKQEEYPRHLNFSEPNFLE